LLLSNRSHNKQQHDSPTFSPLTKVPLLLMSMRKTCVPVDVFSYRAAQQDKSLWITTFCI